MSERIVITDPDKPWLGGNIKGGDEMTYFPELWQFLIDFYEPRSILDIGCGEGHLMKFFNDRFIDVKGIDGMPENKENADPSIKGKIIVHDYSKGVCLITSEKHLHTDLVISCEFVEHVEEAHMFNFMHDFSRGDVIVMTHALPHQDGYHHVNCKESAYWAEIVEKLGYHFLSSITRDAYELAVKYNKVLWKTVLIFERDAR